MVVDKIITIFGGTGFLGKVITQELARAGYRIKIVTRHPEAVYDLKVYGTVGQICPVFCDYKNEESVAAIVQGSDYVINLVGILFEKKKKGFEQTHTTLPAWIAKACTSYKVKKFIHLSALGIEKSPAKYAKTKLEGEQAVRDAYGDATILRPSVVFGPGDGFFNMFAKLSTFLPALPLIGGGKTKFQPVYVGDIADVVAKIVHSPEKIYAGQTYELGGPDIVNFKEIYEIILRETNRKRLLLTLPTSLAKIQAAFMGLLPNPPLTIDQIRSLQTDNIVNNEAHGFKDLELQPTAMDVVLPQYLGAYRRGGRFLTKSVSQTT